MTLEEWKNSTSYKHDVAEDRFLIEEGFDLLAAFRAIKSQDVRKSIISMIATIAHSQAEGNERS